VVIWLVVVFEGNIKVLSNVLNFTVCDIIVLVVIIVIVRDVVNDVGRVTSLTVIFIAAALELPINFLTKLWGLLDHFALWVDTGCFAFDASS